MSAHSAYCISVAAAQRHCWTIPQGSSVSCHQCVAVLHGQHLCHLQVEGLFVARKLSHLPPIASCWSSSSTALLDPCCMHPAPLPCPAAAITGYRLMAVSSAGTVMTEGSGTPLGNGQVGGGAPHHVARCHTHTRAGHMPSTCLHPVLPKMTELALQHYQPNAQLTASLGAFPGCHGLCPRRHQASCCVHAVCFCQQRDGAQWRV